METQRRHIRAAVKELATLAKEHKLLITHGNGPQVGLLAEQASNYPNMSAYLLDEISAETEGLLAYLIEQELLNQLPDDRATASILTMVEVNSDDPALYRPTKPIGPYYSEAAKKQLEHNKGWSFKQFAQQWRRIVASPHPQKILQLEAIKNLLESDTVVICAGGGGIPVLRNGDGYRGVEAVIDKDLTSALLASQINISQLILATEADGVYQHWGTAEQRLIKEATVEQMAAYRFEEGSMQPKVDAACQFVRSTGRSATIGALKDLAQLIKGHAGTRITR